MVSTSPSIGIINFEDPILITVGFGFMVSKVVRVLHEYDFRYIRFFIRPTSTAKFTAAVGG